MSDFTSYPRQDAYETTLTSDINNSVTTIGVSTAPDFTLSSGSNYAVIDFDKPSTKLEVISFTGISGSNLTGVTRGIAKYEGGPSTADTHASGAKVIITNNWKTWADVATAINSKADKAGDTFTGPVDFSGASTTFRLPNLTTTERDALVSPQNGMKIYNTTAGEEQIFDGGVWQSYGTASVPNGSDTVAGIWEGATVAEQGSQSATGGTGAGLVLQPKNLVKTSSGASDENKIPILNASGQFDNGFINGAGVDIKLTYVPVVAGEAVDGSTTPQLVALSDGTGGRTAGRFYRADADDTTNMPFTQIGFITENASSVGTSYNVYRGEITGFTGLTAGARYYTSTTAGSITTTLVNQNQRFIGVATSTTTLYVFENLTPVVQQLSMYAQSPSIGQTLTHTLNTGYKAAAVRFNVYMRVDNAAFTSSARKDAIFNGTYDGTSWVWTAINQAAATESFDGITVGNTAPSLEPTSGDRSSLTMGVTFNDTSTDITFTNAIESGPGSTNTSYTFTATIIPY